MRLYEKILENGYRERPSQKRMIEIINNADGGIFSIKAPTGTGKTFAYLIPLIEKDEKVIISTATKSLQDQLKSDIEKLSQIASETIPYTVIKGRGNYLCPAKYFENKEKGLIDSKTAEIIEDALENQDWDGDLDSIKDLKHSARSLVNIDSEFCDSVEYKTCQFRKDGKCYLKQMFSRVALSKISIVNHSITSILLNFFDLSDVVVVIDEAHEFSEYASRALTGQIGTQQLRSVIAGIDEATDFFTEAKNPHTKKAENSLANLSKYLSSHIKPDQPQSLLKDDVFDFLRNAYLDIKLMIKSFFSEYDAIADKEYDAIANTQGIGSAIEKFIVFEIMQQIDADKKRIKEYLKYTRALRKGASVLAKMEEFINSTGDYILYTEADIKKMEYQIFKQPILPTQAGKYLKDAKSVFFVSATLSSKELERELGIKLQHYDIDPVFNYKENLQIVVKNVNYKNEEQWRKTVLEAYEELINEFDVVLILTTNREHLEMFRDREEVAFATEYSIEALKEKLQKGEKKAIAGLDRMWTGVDIRGDKGVLILKLPFPKLDIITQARQVYMQQVYGLDNFEYSALKAVIKTEQGIGRAIRQEDEKSKVVLCDNRIFYKTVYNNLSNYLKPSIRKG